MLPPYHTLLLLDYDSTLTTRSTIPTILSLSTYPHPSPLSPSLTKAYTTALATHNATYPSPRHTRTTLAAEISYLDSLHAIEESSIHRLESSGVFRGVTHERIRDVAAKAVRRGEVVFRPGWAGMVGGLQARGVGGGSRGMEGTMGGGRVAIVSVGWSRVFIEATIAEAVRVEGEGQGGGGAGAGSLGEGEGEEGRRSVVVDCGGIDVRANEILDDGSGCLDRVFSSCLEEEGGGGRGKGGGIWTVEGKVRAMRDAVRDYRDAISADSGSTALGEAEGGGKRLRTVYVGDSSTDLACLLEADIGICMRGEEGMDLSGEQIELKEMLDRMGVRCGWIGNWGQEEMTENDEERGKRLWWTRGLNELREVGILE